MWLIDLIKEFSIFGLGSEPIALTFAGVIALVVNMKLIKERDYYHAAMTFGMAWITLFSVGIASNVIAIVIYYLIVLTGMALTRKDITKVAHTVSNS